MSDNFRKELIKPKQSRRAIKDKIEYLQGLVWIAEDKGRKRCLQEQIALLKWVIKEK